MSVALTLTLAVGEDGTVKATVNSDFIVTREQRAIVEKVFAEVTPMLVAHAAWMKPATLDEAATLVQDFVGARVAAALGEPVEWAPYQHELSAADLLERAS